MLVLDKIFAELPPYDPKSRIADRLAVQNLRL